MPFYGPKKFKCERCGRSFWRVTGDVLNMDHYRYCPDCAAAISYEKKEEKHKKRKNKN